MKILFLCTHNSCRSILSEALFNHIAPPEFTAVSAGSFPSGQVNPYSLQALVRAGVSTDGLSSKSTDAFALDVPNIVITVCDNAANEPCPIYLGDAVHAHWGLSDPSELVRSETAVAEEKIAMAFDECVAKIKQRTAAFLALPLDALVLDKAKLQSALDNIGKL